MKQIGKSRWHVGWDTGSLQVGVHATEECIAVSLLFLRVVYVWKATPSQADPEFVDAPRPEVWKGGIVTPDDGTYDFVAYGPEPIRTADGQWLVIMEAVGTKRLLRISGAEEMWWRTVE